MNAPSRSSRILCAFVVVTAGAVAHAHSVDLFAYASGDTIHGTVTYADGKPIANATVEVSWSPTTDTHGDSASEATVQTNEDGEFEFKPPSAAEYLFICRTADGHRAAKSVVYGGNASAATPMDESIQQQLNAMQEQLHEHERQTRFRDILGGIGYILGLAGLFALIKSRKRTA